MARANRHFCLVTFRTRRAAVQKFNGSMFKGGGDTFKSFIVSIAAFTQEALEGKSPLSLVMAGNETRQPISVSISFGCVKCTFERREQVNWVTFLTIVVVQMNRCHDPQS